MKYFNGIFYVLLVLILASSATALTISSLDLGSSSQVRGQDVTGTLHIVNDIGNQTLNIALSSTLPTSYNVRFGQNTITGLAPGGIIDVPVTIYVPLSQSSDRTQVSGNIVAADTPHGISTTSNVFLTTISELELYKVTLEINGDVHSIGRSDTYNKDDLKAGTPIKLTIYVRNNFDSSDDIEIDSVTADIRSSGDLDIDESDDFNDLQYGDKDQVSIDTTIPSDASDGDTYNIDIKAHGRDSNGALHSDTFSIRLEVKRPTHEITITSATIYPTHVSCGGRVTITSTIKNTGRNNEDQVHLLIENNDLGISQRFYNMQLDEDSSLTKTYTFNLDNKTQAGQYDFMLTSFYNSNSDSDNNAVSLTVDPCVQQPANTNTNTNNNNQGNNNNNANTLPVMPVVSPSSGATVAYGSSTFADSPLYIVLLVAGVVVLLVILIILLVKFVF